MQAWRWCFFLGCIPPVYWISDLVVHFLVLGVESTLFTTRQVLYYTYGVRVSPAPDLGSSPSSTTPHGPFEVPVSADKESVTTVTA